MSYFCPKCGSLMTAKKEGGKTALVCPRCGYRRESSPQDKKLPTLSKKITHSEKEKLYVISSEDTMKTIPRVKGVKCPKCGNDEAFYYVMQTRRADEPPTRFYKCTKCSHTWREYE